MTQTLADLHVLARDAGVPRYRSLARAELVEALGLTVAAETTPPSPNPRRRRGTRKKHRRVPSPGCDGSERWP